MTAQLPDDDAGPDLAMQIGKLEGELSAVEAERSAADQMLLDTRGNIKKGAAVFMIGILVVLFLFPWQPASILLVLIGAVALFVAMRKEDEAKTTLAVWDSKARQIEGTLGELRPLLQAPAPPTNEDTAAKLEKLKALFDANLITAAEYQAKRAELLSRL